MSVFPKPYDADRSFPPFRLAHIYTIYLYLEALPISIHTSVAFHVLSHFLGEVRGYDVQPSPWIVRISATMAHKSDMFEVCAPLLCDPTLCVYWIGLPCILLPQLRLVCEARQYRCVGTAGSSFSLPIEKRLGECLWHDSHGRPRHSRDLMDECSLLLRCVQCALLIQSWRAEAKNRQPGTREFRSR